MLIDKWSIAISGFLQ